MKITSLRSKNLRSGVLRWVAILILSWSWFFDVSLPYAELRLLIPMVLVMRELLLRVSYPESIISRQINWQQIEKDKDTWKISLLYNVLLINRIYLFPVILTIYLSYLIILQTWLFAWDFSVVFLALDEQLLLVLTIISGIGMVMQEDKDAIYIEEKKSIWAVYRFMVFAVILGVLWWYIVLQQVLSLWWMWVVIANIAGILIFLVGVLLMSDDM